jgi:predicted NBD/HSP70 family sugar kinase
MITGSKELIRDINTRLVLETIIKNTSISRASIAKYLGLTKATISAIVQELINKKLVVEIGSDDTSLGRKPILLSLNKKAGYVICIDIGVDTISSLVSDLIAEERSLKQIKTPKSSLDLVPVLIALIESMKLPKNTPYGLVGITLGIHGVIANNQVSFTPYYSISNINFEKELKEYFNVPVLLENEANLSVIGEMTFRYDYANMANISVHSGIGLGIIINHQLYTGYNGRAGELGHTIIEIDGRTCPCGNKGCLEQYVSERVLLQQYAKKKGMNTISFDYFRRMVEDKDPDAQEIMNQFVKYMSLCINNVMNTYNPDIVVINSSFTICFPDTIKEIEKALNSKMNSYIQIVPSSLQDTSILLGGISVAIKNFLGIDQFKLEHLDLSK